VTLLATVVVLYLALTAVVATATALGAPLLAATRTGHVVGRVGTALVVALDLLTLARGHRPAETATHLGYAACALALPSILTGRRGVTGGAGATPWLVALTAAGCAVVLVRLGQTWA
jgi:hypothetical protein